MRIEKNGWDRRIGAWPCDDEEWLVGHETDDFGLEVERVGLGSEVSDCGVVVRVWV